MNVHVHPYAANELVCPPTTVTIYDRPCGFGKSTHLLNSFQRGKRYLVVVPTLDEIENRYLPETDRLYGEGFFTSPSIDEKSTKYSHIRELLIEGVNIVTTHALYAKLVLLAKEGLLRDYEVIIDEVLDCVKQFPGPKPKSWKNIYKGKWADVDPVTGQVIVLQAWTDEVEEMDDALDVRFYETARAGCLYLLDDRFWIWSLPVDLFRLSQSVTIYTYMAEGTLMMPYLQKLGVHVEHDVDEVANAEMKRRCRELIEVVDIPTLAKIKLSDGAQDRYTFSSDEAQAVATALSTLNRRKLADVPAENILITCKKRSWFRHGKGPKEIDDPRAGPFATKSRMFTGTNWIPNTTRGTNNYRHCTDLIYLYDQNPATQVVRWLNMEEGYHAVSSRFALAELIQWVFRSQIRDGKPITLYLPSRRMQKIFNEWRNN